MSEELTPYDMPAPRMTKKQVFASIDRARGNMVGLRDELLALFEGKAHEVMGCKSFIDFAQEYVGINVSESTIKRHLTAGRVQRVLSGFQSQRGVIMTPLPLLAAVELSKLPPEEADAVYTTYLAAKGETGYTPEEADRELGRLVRARLAERSAAAQQAPAPVITKPVETAKPRNNMTPVVPPTYGRGPEFDDDPVDTGAMTVAETEDPSVLGGYVNSQVEDRVSDASPIAPEDVLCASMTLLRNYARMGHSDDLWCNVCAFVKEYGQ